MTTRSGLRVLPVALNDGSIVLGTVDRHGIAGSYQASRAVTQRLLDRYTAERGLEGCLLRSPWTGRYFAALYVADSPNERTS